MNKGKQSKINPDNVAPNITKEDLLYRDMSNRDHSEINYNLWDNLNDEVGFESEGNSATFQLS